MHVGGIFCDFAKAFDCVNHEILLIKLLGGGGIQGATASSFRSYVTDRKQKTEIKSSHLTQSTYNKVWSSPRVNFMAFAFPIDINDLPPTLNTSSVPIIFADDTSVIISGKNLGDFCILSNRVLSHMNKSFSANKVFLILDKTNVIKFITKNLKIHQTLDIMINT
jgi:hypothetical protein